MHLSRNCCRLYPILCSIAGPSDLKEPALNSLDPGKILRASSNIQKPEPWNINGDLWNRTKQLGRNVHQLGLWGTLSVETGGIGY